MSITYGMWVQLMLMLGGVAKNDAGYVRACCARTRMPRLKHGARLPAHCY